jgi:GntR family transcriptional regulator
MELFAGLQQPDASGLPKYQRLVNTLVEAIRRGLWRPGDRLPAEEELTQMTPFSLGTVQRALRDLTDRGLVVRQHGLGSFVAERQRELENPWHCRFVETDSSDSVLPIYSHAVQRMTVNERGPWTRYLGAQRDLMRLDRIIDVNHEFRISSRFYADRSLLKRLWDMPMERLHGANFKQVIARQCQLPITDIVHMVRTAEFDDEACAAIGVAAGTSGLFMQAVAHAGRAISVYYQEFFIAPNDRALQFPEHTPAATH